MPDLAVVTAFKGTDKLSPVFNKMSGSADKFGRHSKNAFMQSSSAASRFGSMLKGVLPILSVGAVVSFANKSIEAWGQQESAIANVEAGLKSTQNAIGITSKEFQKMGQDIQNTGIFGDEVILQNATAQLLTFGNISKKVFDRTQRAALDVTAKLYGIKASGEQIRATSVMMGKAMDDPARGMSALRRVGIAFTKEEELKIKAMQKSNNITGAQKIMLKAIEKQYGGTNEALRKTNKGMEIAAKNKLGDTMETIGKQLVPIKQGFLDFAVKALPYVNTGIELLMKNLPMLIKIFLTYKSTLIAVRIAQGAIAVGGIIKYFKALTIVQNILTAKTLIFAAAQKILTIGMWALRGAMMATLLAWPVLAIMAIAFAAYKLYKNWDTVKAGFISFFQAIPAGLKMVGSAIMTAIMAPVNLVITGIIKLLQLASKIPGIGDRFARAASSVASFQQSMNNTVGAKNLMAPNASEVRSSKIDFQGNINIAGAPAGSTVSSKTSGAPDINMALMGAM
jgi:hypothetical protein